MEQKKIQFSKNRIEKLVINDNRGRPTKPLNESLNDEIKARVDSESLKSVMASCRGRGIDRSKYIRQLVDLDTSFFDLVPTMNEHVDELVPLLLKLSKKF